MKDAIKPEDIIFNEYIKNDEEYIRFQNFLDFKTSALFDHESQVRRQQLEQEMSGFRGGYSTANCFFYDYEGIQFCVAGDNKFKGMIKEQYLNAFRNYPDLFGTGNAVDVIIALYKINGYEKTGWFIQHYVETALTYDTNCYVVQRNKGVFDYVVLRIDLFKRLLPNKKDWHKMDFVGGLFHVLKHFSYRGKNLSIGNEIQDVDSLEEVVLYCIHAFVHKK